MNPHDQGAAWNRVAARYQAHYAADEAVVHYGPWAPSENTLNLLDDVHGLRILELGCGGGQCSVAFAQQGAEVVGVDISTQQLMHARKRAAQAGVAVRFVASSAADLVGFEDAGWDMVFATYALQYVEPLTTCLAECWRVLHEGGRLVFALDHPARDCFIDAEDQEMTLYPVRSYFDERPMHWRFEGDATPMRNAHYPISAWLEMLHTAGFQLSRLVEPQTPQPILDAMWPMDGPLMPMRKLPQAIIFIAEKPGATAKN